MREIPANIATFDFNAPPTMATGSIGSHRAFMGVSLTFSVILVIVLFVGWSYYFDEIKKRDAWIAMDANEKAKSADMEKMGLMIDAGKTQGAKLPDATQLVLEPPPSKTGAAPSAAQHPLTSIIKEMPLLESSDEVVQAVALLEAYWTTPNWRDRVSMVVEPERVEALMKDFYEEQKATDPVSNGLIGKARYNIDGTEILYFRYNGTRHMGTLEVAMRRGKEGRFLLDWESLVGYGEMSFQEFREKRPTKPVLLRVFVREFEYYNFEFSDASKYLCMKMNSENGENSIYAYSERGNALADWLKTSLAGTGPMGFKGFTVKVAFPPNAESNQCVKLLQVVASRWLVLP